MLVNDKFILLNGRSGTLDFTYAGFASADTIKSIFTSPTEANKKSHY